MTTIDQKRMLKLAGLLKEGVEEWIDEEEREDDFSDYVKDVDRDMPTSWPTSCEDEEEADKEEFERMGMGRGAGLEETYIDNMKEAIRAIVREVLLEKAKTYKGKSMRLGGGGRFAKFVDSLKKSGKSEEQASAIAYKAGVKKYGKEKMKKMATAGKKREAKKK